MTSYVWGNSAAVAAYGIFVALVTVGICVLLFSRPRVRQSKTGGDSEDDTGR